MLAGNLEYLISSLPTLQFSFAGEDRNKVYTIFGKYAGLSVYEVHPISILNLEAAKFLSQADYEIFQKINLRYIYQPIYMNTSSKLLNEFSNFEAGLRNEIADLRKSRKAFKTGSSVKEPKSFLIAGSPLEEEVQIMKVQWEKLEELSIGHYADFDALIAYKLKLMILVRWWTFDPQTGFERFIEETQNAYHG